MSKIVKTELVFFNNFKKGKELAFEFFFNAYYKHILGFCIQFLNDKEEATGVTQEAFINLWLNKEKISTINGIKSFLYTYAKSKCLNVLKHKKVKDKYTNDTLNKKEKLLNIQVLKEMKFDSLEFTELENLIDKTIEELPDTTKQIFIKKRFENKKNKDIAKEMGISIKTVEAHMTTALKVLKNKLSLYLPSILINIYLY
ncbi:MAG: RNA polymerase sigma-70 factor [Psychroserpens sp.]|uniref:RNA polymerase sigma-70 factor n=1 Tax=Psychroserpens sp. TaxID=2020870 RepID=UPI0030014E5E